MERDSLELLRIDAAEVLTLSCGSSTSIGCGSPELLYVSEGDAELSSGIRLSAGELVICPPRARYAIRTVGRAASVLRLAFECSGERISSLCGRAIRATARARGFLSVIYSELCQQDEIGKIGSERIIKNALESLLIFIMRDTARADAVGADEECEPITSQSGAVRKYLSENYTAKISLDSLCFLFRSNKTTICRDFKREYGTTVLGYVNAMRIKEAKRLISESEISVTEISAALGFDSVHYFCRLFRKSVGKTPTEYRKTAKFINQSIV